MTPLRARLRAEVQRTRSPQTVVELDYALSYVLAGLASRASLADTLILKGGTALKKLFFGSYRFSEDLDFTALGAPSGDDLEEEVRQAMVATEQMMGEQGPFAAFVERYLERHPHPGRQEAFIVRVKFPWHPEPLCRVKLEISVDEPVLLEPERRALIHGYEEQLDVILRCYRLEEIVAEKLRTLLQTQEHLMVRGWNRPRARDYYDLWRVLGVFGHTLEKEGLQSLVERKCGGCGVSFHSLDDFFTPRLLTEAQTNWERSLGPYMAELPDCTAVLDELRTLLTQMLPDLH